MKEIIPGLVYVPRYLSAEEEQRLTTTIDGLPWITDLRRRVQHYGYRYDYRARAIDPTMHLGALPEWAAALAERLHQDGCIGCVPDQLIVNEYEPGQGIAPHVDCIPCFGDTILSLSLGSACVMTFEHIRQGWQMTQLLEAGSLLVMRGEARYEWKHGIPARKTDDHNGQRLARARRLSLTFRKVVAQEVQNSEAME
ncbi:MAG: alpha-ketoglutarate-dependent dioxygenase AlkB [bacterium]|nr:alpha-ketoglutarate-dependent dioxygenase AlkB [bacterium]